MTLIDIVDYDIINYKKPSMFLIFPYCSFKCGRAECQNSALAEEQLKKVTILSLIENYSCFPLTEAVVCGGLEPMDSWEDLQAFIINFRYHFADDIVIYTGYTEEEIQDKIEWLSLYENIIIKFGRYIPNQEHHFNELLGVELVSPNQYAKAYNVMEGYC
jgi:hypothetical protein